MIIKKSPTIGELINGGGLEIRTLARLAPTIGFQDRPLQPLGYASRALVVHRRLERRTWRL